MTRPNEHWNVLPHGKLTPMDDGMLTVEGRIKMPLMDLPRRMTVVRLHDSRLVVWSAIALDDAAMATFEAFGRPAFLVVPNDHHRLDAKAWKNRYPELKVISPEGARILPTRSFSTSVVPLSLRTTSAASCARVPGTVTNVTPGSPRSGDVVSTATTLAILSRAPSGAITFSSG